MKKFGLEDDYKAGQLTLWQRTKPRIWAVLDEPNSYPASKVNARPKQVMVKIITSALCSLGNMRNKVIVVFLEVKVTNAYTVRS